MEYKTKGVCSQMIQFDIEDNKVRNVAFTGGCNGNLQGRNGRKRSNLPSGRNPLWIQINFLSRSACSRIERSNCQISKPFLFNFYN